MRDSKKERGATLTKKEIKSIPEKFQDKNTEWYEDEEVSGTLMAWERVGKKRWLKVVLGIDKKIGKVSANVVETAGVVDRKNLDEERYKKISH